MKLILINMIVMCSSAFISAQTTFLPRSFKAEFNQIHKSSVSNRIKKSKGLLDYKYPSHIRFETTYPNNIIFVSNPSQTWYYTAPFMEGEPGELTVAKSNNNPLVKFFDLLNKGLVNNKNYKVRPKKNMRTLVFSKSKKSEMGIESADIYFKDGVEFKNISSVILKKLDRSEVKLVFNQIDPKRTFEKDHFIFKAPKNTRISN